MKQVQYKVHTQQGVLLNANESSKNLSAAIRKEIQDAPVKSFVKPMETGSRFRPIKF